MKKTAAQLDREIAEALRARPTEHATKRKPKKSPFEIRTGRLKALQSAMEAAEGDEAWGDTDLESLDGWLGGVHDDLSANDWQEAAMKQLQDNGVLPEHAGAPPPNVYAWNDAFISTYHMNIDSGMNREDAIDGARQNAHDTIKLTGSEHHMIKTDPKLYPKHWSED